MEHKLNDTRGKVCCFFGSGWCCLGSDQRYEDEQTRNPHVPVLQDCESIEDKSRQGSLRGRRGQKSERKGNAKRFSPHKAIFESRETGNAASIGWQITALHAYVRIGVRLVGAIRASNTSSGFKSTPNVEPSSSDSVVCTG